MFIKQTNLDVEFYPVCSNTIAAALWQIQCTKDSARTVIGREACLHESV